MAIFKNILLSVTVAIFDEKLLMGCQTQFWKKTIQGLLQPSLFKLSLVVAGQDESSYFSY
jgi:hypothetical protein